MLLETPQSPSSTQRNPFETILFAVLVTAIVLYPLLWLRYGVSLIDRGFTGSCFRWVFENPESISFALGGWWGTLVLGGLWMKLLDWMGGVIVIKFAGVMVTYLIALFLYRILANVFERVIALTTALFMVIIICTFNTMPWPHYNNLTSLFYIITAYYLLKGLQTHDRRMLLWGGIFTGFNVFLRLPNLLSLFMVSIIIYHGMTNNTSIRGILRNVLYFILGVCITVGGIFLTILVLGQWELYWTSVRNWIFTPSERSDYTPSYQLKALFNWIRLAINRGTITLIKVAAIPVLFWSVYRFVLPRINSIRYKALVSLLTVLLACIIALKVVPTVINLSINDFSRLSFTAIALFVGLSYFTKRVHYHFVSALLIYLLLPIGSNDGPMIAHHGLWLGVGLIIAYIIQHSYSNIGVQSRGLTRQFAVLTFASILLLFSLTGYLHINRYLGATRHGYAIDHPKLRGILLPEVQAVGLNAFLKELEKYVRPGDFLLVYNSIPMLHYLASAPPFLQNPWPDLYSKRVKYYLNKRVAEDAALPVAVTGSWMEFDAGAEIIHSFVLEHGYKLVWEHRNNDRGARGGYQIWLPPRLQSEEQMSNTLIPSWLLEADSTANANSQPAEHDLQN